MCIVHRASGKYRLLLATHLISVHIWVSREKGASAHYAPRKGGVSIRFAPARARRVRPSTVRHRFHTADPHLGLISSACLRPPTNTEAQYKDNGRSLKCLVEYYVEGSGVPSTRLDAGMAESGLLQYPDRERLCIVVVASHFLHISIMKTLQAEM